MAFFRFNRDKGPEEHFYLVEPASNHGGKWKPPGFYWFRTPPGVRVGREPFDESVRRALEAQYPGISFDWRSIVEAPIPSAGADNGRGGGRAGRAAKHAFGAVKAGDEPTDSSEADVPSDVASTDVGV